MLHVAPVPAADPNWGAAFALIGLGMLAAVVGVAVFGRRDLVGAQGGLGRARRSDRPSRRRPQEQH